MKPKALGLRTRYILQPVPFTSWLLYAVAALAPPPATAQVNVLTDNYNNSRTNANLRETMLNTLDVEPSQFGKLFSLPVNGAINAQPRYMQGVSIPGKGTHNVVYVVTHHNDVYAFDADTQGNSLCLNPGPRWPALRGQSDFHQVRSERRRGRSGEFRR